MCDVHLTSSGYERILISAFREENNFCTYYLYVCRADL